jgi:ribosomal protein L44E
MLTYELYRQQIQMYESQLVKYETQQRAFVALASYIEDTIFVYIQKTKRHSEHQLRALKTRLASTNNARALKIERRVTYINAQSSKIEGMEIRDDTHKQTSLAYTSEKVGKLASKHFRQFRHEGIREFLIDQRLSELRKYFRDNQRHRHSD